MIPPSLFPRMILIGKPAYLAWVSFCESFLELAVLCRAYDLCRWGNMPAIDIVNGSRSAGGLSKLKTRDLSLAFIGESIFDWLGGTGAQSQTFA